MTNKPAPPFENHKMCCGTGCDKRKLEADFECMESQIEMLKAEIVRLNRLLKGWIEE